MFFLAKAAHFATMEAVARISKLFGTEGGVLVNLYDTFPEDFDPQNDPLFVTVDNLPVPLWCERFEPHGASGAFALFADIDTPARMEPFVGEQLFVRTDGESASGEDEFFMEDLIGFAVEAGGRQGVIADFYDSDINPLFGAGFDGREVLIPAAEEFIAGIDFENRIIKMVLPEGLMEL